MDYITVHFANDDSQVSQAGNMSNPISFRLRLDLNEQKQVRLYAKTASGYRATEVQLSFEQLQQNQTVDRWQLAPDNNGEPGTYGSWGQGMQLGTIEDGQKVYFWVRARQLDTEEIMNDTSVGLRISGIVEAQ